MPLMHSTQIRGSSLRLSHRVVRVRSMHAISRRDNSGSSTLLHAPCHLDRLQHDCCRIPLSHCRWPSVSARLRPL